MATRANPIHVVIVADAAADDLAATLSPLDLTILRLTGAAAEREPPGRGVVDLIVIDDDAPSIDALAVIAATRRSEQRARPPILLITAAGGGTRRADAIAAGAADVLLRPFEELDLQVRAKNLIELSRSRRQADQQRRSMTRELDRAVAEAAVREREIIRRLMLAAEFRDDQAGDHLTRVAGIAIAIAEGMGLSEDEANDLALASTMHDIGKISIADSILMKPGPLTEAERREMQEHAVRGHGMLQDSPSLLLQLASDIALTHHERWDGKGYPQGLAGTEIPLAGRIIAVADVFDALISKRVYKDAWAPEVARQHVEAHSGSHFDPDCVAAFVSRWDDIVMLLEAHPPV